MILATIVEGHGEVEALPVLLRRIVSRVAPEIHLQVPRPFRVPRGKLVQEVELKSKVEFAYRMAGSEGAVLVLFDSDRDCPKTLAPTVQKWAREVRAFGRVAVVLAEVEYESWFLSAASSLRGYRTLPPDLSDHPASHQLRNAKKWLDERMESGYAETVDQAPLSSRLDLDQARASDSFDKLFRDVCTLVGAPCPPRPERA